MNRQDLQVRVIRALRWQTFGKVSGQVISWASTVLVMRMLAPEDYGLMAMALVVMGLSALVAELGMGSAIVQSRHLDDLHVRRVFGLSVCVTSGIYALIACASEAIAQFFSEPRLVLLLLVAGVQLPISALSVVPMALARRNLDFQSLSLIDLSSQVLAAAATLTAAWAGFEVWSLVIGHLASTGLKAMLLVARFGLRPPLFQFRGQRELMTFGGSITANRLIWYFYSQADIFLAGKLLGSALLGTYSCAITLANLPMQKIVSISNDVAFSAFAKLQDDLPALRSTICQTVELLLALTMAILWGLAAIAPDLVPVLLGPQWVEAILPLQLVALVVPLRVVAALLSTATIAIGRLSVDLVNTMTGALILIPAFYLGATQYGLKGLAMAWLAAYPVFFVIAVNRICSRLEFPFSLILRQFAVPGTAAIAMVCIIYATQEVLADWSAVIRLPIEIGLGAAVFLLTVYWAKKEILITALRMIRT